MFQVLLGVALATALVFLWRYLTNINKHWEERGIPTLKPIPFFGNLLPMLLRRSSPGEFQKKLYETFPDAKILGVYDFMVPNLLIKDLELVERVLIKDFQYFGDRGLIKLDKDSEPIFVNLFNMSGKKWKTMRNKFSPMFTTGKLKNMVPQISDISNTLLGEFEKNPCDIDLKDMFQRFAMDVIASCAFGMDISTLQEKEESEFRKMGKWAFKPATPIQTIRILFVTTFPKVAKALKVSLNNKAITGYFSKVLLETLTHRKNTNFTRNDFVQLMVTLQQKGSIAFEGDETDNYLKTEADEKNGKQKELFELTDDVMVGQAFIFLLAGFEAIATGLMWLFYEFTQNLEIQEKTRQEITKVLKARGGVLDYDALKEMTYFNQCIQECSRLHTFVPILFRMCVKEYTFPGTSLTIKPGQQIGIPVIGIHHDPEVYPEPDKFIPERFDPDVKIPNCAYLPFGDGPRMCIAMRFALTEMKLCGARLLLDYAFKLSPKTILPVEMDNGSCGISPKNVIYFDLTKLSEEPKI